MEIVAGENACYLLLAFISLKMEMNWRTTKIGKVRPNSQPVAAEAGATQQGNIELGTLPPGGSPVSASRNDREKHDGPP
jgi:hypothetical protein